MILLNTILERIKLVAFKKRVKNKVLIEKNAIVEPNCIFAGKNRVASYTYLNNVNLGVASYIGKYCRFENTLIGKFTCVGQRVNIIIGEHPLHYVSMHPAFYSVKKQAGFSFVTSQKYSEYRYADSKGHSVIIGSDVWIASDVRIIEGVTIGDGAVVLPGAIVNNNVPPYAVVGGVPAKVLKYRFEQSQIKQLESIKWWDKDLKWMENNKDLFCDIDLFLEHQ